MWPKPTWGHVEVPLIGAALTDFTQKTVLPRLSLKQVSAAKCGKVYKLFVQNS